MTDRSETLSRRLADQEAVERAADRRLSDTRWDWLRPIGRRRAVVVLWGISVVAGALLTAWDNALVTVLALIVGAAIVWVLRLVVRTVVDLPDEFLDERQVAVRDRVYRTAYSTLIALALVVLLAMYIAWDGERVAYEAQPSHINGVFYALLFGGLGLPSAIYAWTQRDV